MIKAVIFDLDDTLYGYEALDKEARMRVRALVCGELGIAAEDYEEAYSGSGADEGAIEDGTFWLWHWWIECP